MDTALPLPNLLIFDVDGTLIDVTQSYRECAPLAAARYLGLLGITPPPMTGDVYDQMKLMGGFNDDWDLTAGLLQIVLSKLPPAAPLAGPPTDTMEGLVGALHRAAAAIAEEPAVLPDLAALIPAVRSAGGGFGGIAHVTSGRNAHLVWRTGDARRTDLVQRLFSELYLGSELFELSYGFPAHFYEGAGLAEAETLMPSDDTLSVLARHARLGIATGRTRFELAAAVRRFRLDRYFPVSTTMTDALEAAPPGGESWLKPHPFLLEQAAVLMDPSGHAPATYVGDSPDDMLASRRACGRPWSCVAVAPDPSLHTHYRESGAAAVIRHPDDLPALFGLE